MRISNYLSFILVGILFISACSTQKKVAVENHSEKINSAKAIQDKYSQTLRVSEKEIKNIKLYSLIDDWYGAPYKYAGKTKDGIDCSGFACMLYGQVYNKKIS